MWIAPCMHACMRPSSPITLHMTLTIYRPLHTPQITPEIKDSIVSYIRRRLAPKPIKIRADIEVRASLSLRTATHTNGGVLTD